MCRSNFILSAVLVIWTAGLIGGCVSESVEPQDSPTEAEAAMIDYMEARIAEADEEQTAEAANTEAVEAQESQATCMGEVSVSYVEASETADTEYVNPIGRNWQPRTVGYQNVTVNHPRLYCADTLFENEYGYDHEEYSANDLISLVASPPIALGNIAVVPIQLMLGGMPWDQDQSRSRMPSEMEMGYTPDVFATSETTN
ncbi:MAG: hypothetical protein JW936_03295 [Sedimentisphaerales bacterium]|nr:hypothetical protein [Sedimentisphaerales bacterium]